MIAFGLNTADQIDDAETPDQENDDELSEEREKSVLPGCLMIGCLGSLALILAVFIALLFMPVNHRGQDRNSVQIKPAKPPVHKGYGYIGQAHYMPVGAVRTETGRLSKAALVTVRFKITNLDLTKKILNDSMVNLTASGGQVYSLSREFSEKRLRNERKKSPWDKPIAPGQTKTVDAVFIVEKGASNFKLQAKDFDWRSTLTISLDIPEVKNE